MTVAAVILAFATLLLAWSIAYAGSVFNKIRKLSGGYNARKVHTAVRGLRTVSAELREAANVGDATALAALQTIGKIEDELSDLAVEFEDKAKKAAASE